VEGAHQGHTDFRVGTRILATPEQQSMLVEAEPDIHRPVPGGGSRRPIPRRCKARSKWRGKTSRRNRKPSRAAGRSPDFAAHQGPPSGRRSRLHVHHCGGIISR